MQKGFIQPQRDDPISGIEIVVVVKAPSSGWRQREREPAGLLPSVSLLHSRTFFGKLFFSITCGMWKNRLHDGNKELAVTPLISIKVDDCLSFRDLGFSLLAMNQWIPWHILSCLAFNRVCGRQCPGGNIPPTVRHLARYIQYISSICQAL